MCSTSIPRPDVSQRWPTPVRTGTNRWSQLQITPRFSMVSRMICWQAYPSSARAARARPREAGVPPGIGIT